MATEKIRRAVLRAIDTTGGLAADARVLDIGPGDGALIRRLREHYGVQTAACDYTKELMRIPDQQVDIADLNHEPLPYPDASFDLITCTEVAEHLENHFELLREVRRILKPGGRAIFSTPNILNIRSRLGYLVCGFAHLFGPMPVEGGLRESLSGHINPLGAFYFGHAAYVAGLEDVRISIDKWQRGSIPSLAFLWLPIWISAAWWKWRQRCGRRKAINAGNEKLVNAVNSLDVLLGRTVILSARRPD